MKVIRNSQQNNLVQGRCGKTILTAIGLTLSMFGNAQAIRATIDGDLVSFTDVQPVMIKNRVMVPVRGIFEHMNASVTWDSYNHCVIAQRGVDHIELPLNSYLAKVNGRDVRIDTPAIMMGGRVMAPLRFLSESLSATVSWLAPARTVAIMTSSMYTSSAPIEGYAVKQIDVGTVIPFKLVQPLGSLFSKKGDLFDARLETGSDSSYLGLPMGTVLQGHVSFVQQKEKDNPGLLGLAFDQIRLPDGKGYQVFGSLIGLDEQSTKIVDGRIIAAPGKSSDNLKYVGYGAGAGLLVSIIGKDSAINDTLIGAALGFLYGTTQKDPKRISDVSLSSGSKFGVKLERQFTFHILSSQNR